MTSKIVRNRLGRISKPGAGTCSKTLLIVATVLAFAMDSSATVADAQDSVCCGCGLIRNPRSITLRDMWDRDHPDGADHGHHTYQSTGTYYYHRPYNSSHYHQHRLRFQQRAGSESLSQETIPDRQFVEGFQYADSKKNHLFRPLVREAPDSLNRVRRPKDSGVLEFADWRRHESAKSEWSKNQAHEKAKSTTALSETLRVTPASNSAKIVTSRGE